MELTSGPGSPDEGWLEGVQIQLAGVSSPAPVLNPEFLSGKLTGLDQGQRPLRG